MLEPTVQIEELKRHSKATKDVRMKLRYDAVRLYLQGRTRKEIAAILNITYQTVSEYINAYKNSGVDGLIKNPYLHGVAEVNTIISLTQ